MTIENIDPNKYSPDEILSIAADIENIRRIDWITTYVNEEAGITKSDIINSFPILEERMKLTAQNITFSCELVGYWIAKEVERIIGFSVASKGSNHHIGAIYVHPSYQAKGVGSQLMEQMIKWLGDENDIDLEVASFNENAKNFYMKFGFVQAGKGEFPLKNLNPIKAIPTIKMVRFSNSI